MVPFEHLGPYRIGEPIGRGGMGSVFKAIHEKTGEEVAVKVIAAAVSDDIRFRRRFNAEIETLKKLKHPNIVTLIGYGEQHGQLFYSMELVNGESLQQRLRREKRLHWPFVLDMAIDICNALKHAHNFGVIHRDLKPANLLVTPSDSTKLVDFGIAKLFGSSDHTAMGAVLGTADFMAPEQAGDGPITPRTDLYALGNVLYACFAGRPPFAGRTMTRILEAVRAEDPTPLDLIAPDVPSEIVQLVHDLLVKDPDQRPPTALAVMNRMKAIRAGLLRRVEGTDVRDDDGIVGSPQQTESDATQRESAGNAQLPTVLGQSASEERTDLGIGEFTVQGVSPTTGERKRLRDAPTASPAKSLSRTVVPTPLDEAASRHLSSTVASAVEAAGPHAQSSPATGAHVSSNPSVREPVTSPEPPREPPQTHFSTVDENDRRRGIWETEPSPTQGQWLHALSIVGMVTLLLAAVGVFIWAAKKPSADEMYQSMLSAQALDDTTAFRNQFDQFKRLYPEDPRTDQLAEYLDEFDSDRIVRRLKLAALRDGGDEHLTPHQQSFIAAMRDVRRDPNRTAVMLRQWLAVYDPPLPLTAVDSTAPINASDIPLIAKAARQELERLAAQGASAGDSRATELIRRIEWAEETLEQDDYQKLLEGMLVLYEEQPWAQPAVERAQQSLRELKR